jgi:hypothetical protein
MGELAGAQQRLWSLVREGAVAAEREIVHG